MITGDFYPSDIIETNLDIEYTAPISTLTQTVDMFEPYVMGYVPYNYIPNECLIANYEINNSPGMPDDKVTFTKILPANQNIPWFFIARKHTSSSNTILLDEQFIFENGAWTALRAPTYQYRLLNSFDISYNGYSTWSFYVSARHVNLDNPNYTQNGYFTGHGQEKTFSTVQNFIDWLYNDDFPLTFTTSFPNNYTPTSMDITIHPTDFENGVNSQTVTVHNNTTNTDESISIEYFISRLTHSSTIAKNSSSQTAQYPNEQVAYQYQAPEDFDSINVISCMGGGNYVDNAYKHLNISTAESTFGRVSHGISHTLNDKTYICGGFNGEINGAWLRNAPAKTWSYFGNMLVEKSGQLAAVFLYYTTNEIKLLLEQCGINLRDGNATYGFQDGVFVPMYKSDDSPNWLLLTGDLADIQASLRPWQLGNIRDNDFTWDDIPPYVPPHPGGEEENTGSDIIRPGSLGVGGTNGFITQYSLTASQIAEIGRLLWLSFTDPDYYKNFLFTLTTTGTLNLSNLLDYFVSLRVYPFPLVNVPSHSGAGNDMYIGAGITPLHFSSTLHTINNYADYINAGSCHVPRYFGDFRDFTHTQILLFLPYCGTVQLNPADVIGGTLYAQYAIDFATGGVNAYVDLVTHDGRQFMIASLSGNIGADVPLTATNAAQIASKIAGDALNFAGTVSDTVQGDLSRSAGAVGSALTGNYVGAAAQIPGVYAGRLQGAADIARQGFNALAADGVKMPILSGGRGFGGFGQPQTAYIQIRRGIYAEGQIPTTGFKSTFGDAYAQAVQVSSCTGFTVFSNVNTGGLQCDADERTAIQNLMQSGIYI